MSGYGRVNNRLAHRIAYEEQVGPIPDGFQVHHLCHTKPCVNVEHMELLTVSEHARLHSTGRTRVVELSHCPHGHAYTPENNMKRRGKQHECRECRREYKRRKRRERALEGGRLGT